MSDERMAITAMVLGVVGAVCGIIGVILSVYHG